MTARLIVSNAARRDLRAILDYLEHEAGSKIALRYALEFDNAIDRIAEFPDAGSPRPQYGQDVRLAIVNPYLIFYATGGNRDDIILRVLHGHHSITRRMLRDPR